MCAGEIRGEAKGGKSTELARGGHLIRHHLWRFPQKRSLAPGPSWQLLQSRSHVRHLSALCEDRWKSRPFTVCLGPLLVFPPLPATEKERGKSYKVSPGTVRIAKKRKENKTTLTKETCSRASSLSKAPFIHSSPQMFVEQNCVPSFSVSIDNMFLTPTEGRHSLSCSVFPPKQATAPGASAHFHLS